MDQATLVTLVVGAIVAILGLFFRAGRITDPAKSWIEMVFSIAGAIVIAFVLGKLSPFPGAGDPLAAIKYFLESAAIVFTFVQIVYSAVRQFFPESTISRAAFGVWVGSANKK